ncbi:hypothetical protein IW147_004040 [Coemansia sp. RSA 720]|nr:hypothetical protein IW147_004040 [Coemansia sp. RSA 720]
MAEFAFGRSAEQELTTPYTQQFYPVLGVLNGPWTNAENMTSYGRQVARSILKYFRGGDSSEHTENVGDRARSEHIASGWDPVGAARGPRWQTASFDRVDDIPRRKSRTQGIVCDLSPRSSTSELQGDGLMTPKWVERQQRRPATVVSLHTLQDGTDTRLSEEMARNRVCLAAFGVSYTAVVIVNRGASEDGTEARLSAIMQRGGLEQAQFAVCRPGSGPQFQAFLNELERGLFARAAAFYANAFVHTQAKLALLPQLPLPDRPEDPASVYEIMQGDSAAQALSARLLGDTSVVQRFSRYLPVRGWLVRYHFKLGVAAECAGDRDTAQRCMWLAYVHAAAFVGEIASGAYLPAEGGTPSDGWMWALNGGDGDGQRARSLRMFGQRWDELLVLLDALHVRLVRGWIYQSLDISALRATQASAGTSGGWPYAFGGSSQRFNVTPVNRSGPPAPVPISPGGPSPTSASSPAGSVGGNSTLDALVLSVHAGEVNAATEQLMTAERTRRANGGRPTVHFLALGSETRDIDLLPAPDARTFGWWPLGGFYAVIDFGRSGQQTPTRRGLVLNSARDVNCVTSLLPTDTAYDVCLALAGRQCAEHVLLLARVLKQSGFGEESSYFWARIERQYTSQAALYVLAASHGMSFARALSRATMRLDSGTAQTSNVLVGSLRQPRPRASSVLLDRMESAPVVGRARAPSTAFAGFAFDQALGGIYAVVEPKKPAVATMPSGSGDSLFPLWMWPENASYLFRAAALASLKRSRQLHTELSIYMPEADAVGDKPQRVFSANPGVENTYVATWLASERSDSNRAAHRTCQLLASALACVGESRATSAAREIAAQSDDVDALVELITQEPSAIGSHFYLYLASELAEVYAESDRHGLALRIFGLLAERFRAEGWAQLTAHALQWTVKCAMAVDDRVAAVRAMLELLSPQLATSAERLSAETDLLKLAVGVANVVVDMSQIYSPILCHAQWRHWDLGSSNKMHFQVAIDCRALQHSLPLTSLKVEFNDPHFNVCVDSETQMCVDDVSFASSDSVVRVFDLEASGSGVLELKHGCVSVFQGAVVFGSDSAVPPNGMLAIDAVTACVGGTGDGQAVDLRLKWPTCAPAQANDSAFDDALAEDALAHIEKLLLSNIGVARVCGSALGQKGGLKLNMLPTDADVPALRRAVRITGPASSLAEERRWLHTIGARWVQMPAPPLLTMCAEPGFSAYSRCRVLKLPKSAPVLELHIPSVAAQAPAYIGETFPVQIKVRNVHQKRVLAGVSVDVQLVTVDPDGSSTDLRLLQEKPADVVGALPWLQQNIDDDANTREIRGLECGDLQPQAVHMLTVYVRIPGSALHGAERPSAASPSVTAVRCTARYGEETVMTQASIPVVRPLYAEAKVLETHVSAPAHVETDSPSTEGEYRFRRAVRVRLGNSGPWDVNIEDVKLHTVPNTGMHVSVAGSTASTQDTLLQTGTHQDHVIWLDVRTSDVLRAPSTAWPGWLQVQWRRHPHGAVCVTRLWLRPLELLRRCVQVTLQTPNVARVGHALCVSYRVLNATRRLQTMDVAMHASDAFVFAGQRRATLHVLPGHEAQLQYNMLPLCASLGNMVGWVPLPRLDVRLARNVQNRPGSALSGSRTSMSGPRMSGTQVHGATPPPTRKASAVVLGPTAHVAQETVAALAGVNTGDLSPALAAACASMVPELVDCTGAESDFESDVEDLPPVAATGGDVDEVVRYDQTSIFCMPAA